MDDPGIRGRETTQARGVSWTLEIMAVAAPHPDARRVGTRRERKSRLEGARSAYVEELTKQAASIALQEVVLQID
jgi:hypothetical protein